MWTPREAVSQSRLLRSTQGFNHVSLRGAQASRATGSWQGGLWAWLRAQSAEELASPMLPASGVRHRKLWLYGPFAPLWPDWRADCQITAPFPIHIVFSAYSIVLSRAALSGRIVSFRFAYISPNPKTYCMRSLRLLAASGTSSVW